jgi:hypothetical protein
MGFASRPHPREPLASLADPRPALPNSQGGLTRAEAHAKTLQTVHQRIDLLASHMSEQMSQHEQAMVNTRLLFERLLDELDLFKDQFSEAFAQRSIPLSQIYTEIDPDRSMGMLNVLWHPLTFTTRGNQKPLAFQQPGRPPRFSGRIVAFHGDFHHLMNATASTTMSLTDTALNGSAQFQDWLRFEIASLYIPADPDEPATMTIRHLNDQRHQFHQEDAARLFLLRTVDMVCSGGFIHE